MDLAKFTQELAHKLPQYTIIFKAHPSEYHFARQQYRFLTEISNVEIVDNDKISLYEYFSLSSILIGIHSTALIEGLAFDMKVLVLKYPGWECYKEYSKNNESLSFISDANEACLSIHNSYQSGSASTSIEPMFKENALENSLEIL
jgi:CDP-glycerol glycerophosphotransferase (TagB/SpsB family)